MMSNLCSWEYFHLAFLLRMPKTSVDFLIYKGLQGRSSDALIYLHRRKQSALTEFFLCYFIKHHFRNHNEAIMKNTAFFSERTHTDIKGNMYYFKCYTSANIFHIFSVKRPLLQRYRVSQCTDYYFSDKETKSKLSTMLLGVLFFSCFLFVFSFRYILKSGWSYPKVQSFKIFKGNSFSAFISFDFLINFLFNLLQKLQSLER